MDPVELTAAAPLRAAAEARVATLRSTILAMGIPAEVIHVGSTAHATGLTKGDVDALVRVEGELFDGAREAFRDAFTPAQVENWTADFASFTDESGDLPIGVQAVRVGSEVDRSMRRGRALLERAEVRAAYDRVKERAAPDGPEAYWAAKDAFWTWLHATADRSAT